MEDVVSKIRNDGGKAIGVRADVSNERDVKRVVSKTRRSFGKIDGLVCMAGYPMIEKLWNTNLDNLNEKKPA